MSDILNMEKWRFRLPTLDEVEEMVDEAIANGAKLGLARDGCGGSWIEGIRLCGDADDKLTLCWNGNSLDIIHEHAFENYAQNDRYWDFYGRTSWTSERAMQLLDRIKSYCK